MKRLLLILLPLITYGQVVPQPTAPPAALDNWSTAKTALALADPGTTNQVAGWDNTNKQWTWVTAGGVAAPVVLTLNTLNAATIDALSLINTTAATASVQQYSPDLRWQGQGWKATGTTSQMTEWRAYVAPASDTTAPENWWYLDSRTNSTSGTWTTRLALWDGQPSTTIGSTLFVDAYKVGGTAGKGIIEFGTQSGAPPNPGTNNVSVYANSTGDLIAKKTSGTTVNLTSPTGGGTVTTTGTPASGNLTAFSGTTSITNTNLTGDVTTSNGVAATIPAGTVTYAKMQNVSATSRFLGRITAAAGVVEELTATNAKTILSLTALDVGLGSVTNDAQTKAAIVPNTAPTAGQILVGNAGNTAYAPATVSGSGATISLASTGVMTISAIPTTSITAANSASWRAVNTDENGTGVALYNGATTPDFTTGITIGTAAASRKVLVGDGTKFAASTETYAVPGTSGNILTSDGTNWTSAAPVVTASSTTTFTNKRINPRVDSSTSASATTWAPNSDTTDIFELAGTLTVAVTTISNPSGTPVDGQKLTMRIKSDATPRALTWSGTQWRASSDLPLPSPTVASKTMYLLFIYNSTDTKWDLIAYLTNF